MVSLLIMKKIQKIGATEARNDFFNLLTKSFKKKQPYLIEKGKIPTAYLIPVTLEKPGKGAGNSYADELLKLKGSWFSYKDWVTIREEVANREL